MSGVAVHPEQRGNAYGQNMVKKAFKMVDNGHYCCSIFQTNVPAFYEALGASIFQNPFINSNHTTDPTVSPWSDAFAMIYPGNFSLGNSVIDLRRDAY